MKKHVQKHVTITDIGDLDTHLGVHYALEEDEIGKYFSCSMSKYISSIVEDFEKHD